MRKSCPSVCFGTAPLSQPDAAAACISATPPARFRLLMTTRCSRSGSSSLSVGDSSKFAPPAAGVHDAMSAPCGMYMKPVRIGRAASVFANPVAAGTIASSSGSASEALTPLRKVRLGIASLVISIFHPHLKRHTRDDRVDERREPVVLAAGAPDDGADGRHVLRRQPAPERIE